MTATAIAIVVNMTTPTTRRIVKNCRHLRLPSLMAANSLLLVCCVTDTVATLADQPASVQRASHALTGSWLVGSRPVDRAPERERAAQRQ